MWQVVWRLIDLSFIDNSAGDSKLWRGWPSKPNTDPTPSCQVYKEELYIGTCIHNSCPIITYLLALAITDLWPLPPSLFMHFFFQMLRCYTARYSVTLFRGEKTPTRPHTHGSNVTLMYWVLSYIMNSFLFPCSFIFPSIRMLAVFVPSSSFCAVCRPLVLARRGGGRLMWWRWR